MGAQLRLLGEGREPTYPLGPRFTIGRLASNTLPLADDAGVSREHAAITGGGNVFIIEDLHSRNGSYLERGAQKWQLMTPTQLEEGDIVQIGSARLRFETAPMAGQAFSPSATIAPGETTLGLVLPQLRRPRT